MLTDIEIFQIKLCLSSLRVKIRWFKNSPFEIEDWIEKIPNHNVIKLKTFALFSCQY